MRVEMVSPLARGPLSYHMSLGERILSENLSLCRLDLPILRTRLMPKPLARMIRSSFCGRHISLMMDLWKDK